ncbi:hypothetical protein VSH64_13610 [Amycolatopsis rhabdoformis]|uniref:DUF7617 domain-containing protein n=1 Tax=Amycolatopsis rhabdoformis TaxID=1448059 RepID=A0ABZ1IGC5_9PSEU|nr:hypothetical protein [Amycolatopsis rhabdoformis]WSE33141.1 hypothetical protein VSH64_13610 [Amycolatopsis rhabdoformis]
MVTDPAGHQRSYLPAWGGPYPGVTLCHDWTTASACAGLPVLTTTLVLKSSADFAGGNQPQLVVGFTGDAPQVCFRTAISADRSVAGVTNTATGTDPTGTFTSNTVALPVAPGSSCTPVVTQEREICTSAGAAKCGPGGSGPWAKQAPVGLLDATAYWRITVTDQGPVGISGTHVVDSVEPSRQAAAAFSLQPDQTKQVYCSTHALLNLFPITNQAKVSDTPANAPAGTPPSHSAWSSAKACSLLCIL